MDPDTEVGMAGDGHDGRGAASGAVTGAGAAAVADGTEDRAMVTFASAIGSRLRGTVTADVRDRQAAVAATAAAASHSALRRWLGPGRLGPLALAAGLLGIAVIGGLGTLGRDPLPVIAAGGAGGGSPMSAAASAAPGAERSADLAPGDMTKPAEVPSDLSIWRPTAFRFELADGVRVDGAGGEAWAFEAPRDVAGAAADLAAMFGLPAPRPAEWGGGSFVADRPDGTTFSISGSGDWFLSAPPDAWPQWTCPERAASDGSVECAPPAPAVGLPSDAEAERLALELLTRAGVTGVRRTDVYRDDWTVSFAGEVALPGGPAGLGAGVYATFGDRGRVLSVSATLARPVALGRYPTVDVATAVARLQADMDAPVQAMPLPAVEPGGPERSTEIPPPAPAGEPEVVEVRIVGAELAPAWAWTPEGRMLVVPHYRLRDADGGEWWVIAVEDRYLAR